MLGWWSETVPACASSGWCLGFKEFQPGLHPSGTTPEKSPIPGPPWPGHRGLSGVILWLAEGRCQHFSQGGKAVRMGGTFPAIKRGNQGRKEENFHYQGRIIRTSCNPLCRASAYHSGPQQQSKCSILSLNNSNSAFFWDGEHTHPSNARPTAAWQGRAGLGWRESSARLSPEPGHDEGEGDGHSSSKGSLQQPGFSGSRYTTSGCVAPWDLNNSATSRGRLSPTS